MARSALVPTDAAVIDSQRAGFACARAPLRISLAGGGTDIPSYYRKTGGKVIALSIDRYVITTVQVTGGDAARHWNQLDSNGLALTDAARDHLQVRHNVSASVLSDVPPGVGLGGSGAFSVSLLAALGVQADSLEARISLGMRASGLEIDYLRRPVGHQDHLISAVGGLISMTFDARGSVSVERLPTSESFAEFVRDRLLLFRWSGAQRDAGVALAQQAARAKNDESRTIAALDEMRSMAFHLHEKLLAGNFEAVGPTLALAWATKRSLAPEGSYGKIDPIYSAARAAGARGVRLVGAGGSGYMLVEVPSVRAGNGVREAMAQLSLPELSFGFESEGVVRL